MKRAGGRATERGMASSARNDPENGGMDRREREREREKK